MPMSEKDSIPLTPACTDFGGLYTPGASVAVMTALPVAPGVSHVIAMPFWSVTLAHDDAPPQTESCTEFAPLHPTVAPATGMIPLAATTRTSIGFAVCMPTGVDGFTEPSSTMLSVAAAPQVSTLLMLLKAPLT